MKAALVAILIVHASTLPYTDISFEILMYIFAVYCDYLLPSVSRCYCSFRFFLKYVEQFTLTFTAYIYTCGVSHIVVEKVQLEQLKNTDPEPDPEPTKIIGELCT